MASRYFNLTAEERAALQEAELDALSDSSARGGSVTDLTERLAAATLYTFTRGRRGAPLFAPDTPPGGMFNALSEDVMLYLLGALGVQSLGGVSCCSQGMYRLGSDDRLWTRLCESGSAIGRFLLDSRHVGRKSPWCTRAGIPRAFLLCGELVWGKTNEGRARKASPPSSTDDQAGGRGYAPDAGAGGYMRLTNTKPENLGYGEIDENFMTIDPDPCFALVISVRTGGPGCHGFRDVHATSLEFFLSSYIEGEVTAYEDHKSTLGAGRKLHTSCTNWCGDCDDIFFEGLDDESAAAAAGDIDHAPPWKGVVNTSICDLTSLFGSGTGEPWERVEYGYEYQSFDDARVCFSIVAYPKDLDDDHAFAPTVLYCNDVAMHDIEDMRHDFIASRVCALERMYALGLDDSGILAAHAKRLRDRWHFTLNPEEQHEAEEEDEFVKDTRKWRSVQECSVADPDAPGSEEIVAEGPWANVPFGLEQHHPEIGVLGGECWGTATVDQFGAQSDGEPLKPALCIRCKPDGGIVLESFTCALSAKVWQNVRLNRLRGRPSPNLYDRINYDEETKSFSVDDVAESPASEGGRVFHACSHCLSRALAQKRCSRCRNQWYCDRTCQKAAWVRHRRECSPREAGGEAGGKAGAAGGGGGDG